MEKQRGKCCAILSPVILNNTSKERCLKSTRELFNDCVRLMIKKINISEQTDLQSMLDV